MTVSILQMLNLLQIKVVEAGTGGVLSKELFLKIHRKIPVPMSFLMKLQAEGLRLY